MPVRPGDLLFGWLNTIPAGNQVSAHYALYDGTTLLGSLALNFSGAFGFTAPGSLFDFRTGTVSDFSSIADGTIDGILLITNTGSFAIDMTLSPTIGLEVGQGTSVNGYTPLARPVIRSQALLVEVPEPAAMSLMLGGVLAAGFARAQSAGAITRILWADFRSPQQLAVCPICCCPQEMSYSMLKFC